jgi:cytochrome P450
LQGNAPTVQDLPQLRYTSMVIKEAMRLYPPAWVISREPLEDVTFGPHPMKKGSIMLISPYVVHRDPRFFPDPERFDPERFAEGYEKRLPRFAYFPFGGGSHVCIGQPFAMMEATLVLATIAQRYQLQLAPDQRVEIQPLVTLRPKYGMRMRLSPR